MINIQVGCKYVNDDPVVTESLFLSGGNQFIKFTTLQGLPSFGGDLASILPC